MDRQIVLECRHSHMSSISEIYEVFSDYLFKPHAHFALAIVYFLSPSVPSHLNDNLPLAFVLSCIAPGIKKVQKLVRVYWQRKMLNSWTSQHIISRTQFGSILFYYKVYNLLSCTYLDI